MCVSGALIDVVDQPVSDPASARMTPQSPLILHLCRVERMRLREQPSELRDEHPPVAEAGEQRADWRAQRRLSPGERRPLDDHPAVEKQHTVDRETEATFQIACQQLGGDRGSHVVRDDHDAARFGSDQLFGQASLVKQAVDDITRLLGHPKAEEVKRHRCGARQ